MDAKNLDIALFMGCKINNEHKVTPKDTKYTFPHKKNEAVHVNNLRYHISWEWLMPVIHILFKPYGPARVYEHLLKEEGRAYSATRLIQDYMLHGNILKCRNVVAEVCKLHKLGLLKPDELIKSTFAYGPR